MKIIKQSTGETIVVALARVVLPRSHRSAEIIVEDCPYCHNTHHHTLGVDWGGGNILGVREADCWRGEYMLLTAGGFREMHPLIVDEDTEGGTP